MDLYLTTVICIALIISYHVANGASSTEYIPFTTSDTQTVEDLPWPIFGIVFGIMFGVSSSGLFYWFHATYFLFRRYKYGVMGKATIFCREMQEYSGATKKTNKYHVKYVYTDRRYEITEKYINHLISWFILNTCSSSNIYIPSEIHKIIYEYLDNSIIFWYGPYEIECYVSESLYRQSYIGSKIHIKYDPLYPYNCDLYLEPIWCSFCYWFRWFIGLLFSLSGCIFFSFVIAPKLKNNYKKQLIIIILSSFLSVLLIVIISTLWFKGSGCFRKMVKGKLKLTQFDDDHNDNHYIIHQFINKNELKYIETNMEIEISMSITDDT